RREQRCRTAGGDLEQESAVEGGVLRGAPADEHHPGRGPGGVAQPGGDVRAGGEQPAERGGDLRHLGRHALPGPVAGGTGEWGGAQRAPGHSVGTRGPKRANSAALRSSTPATLELVQIGSSTPAYSARSISRVRRRFQR